MWSSTGPTTTLARIRVTTPTPLAGPSCMASCNTSALYGVLQHVGAELSAHETITAEQEHWGSIAQLAAEYETIAAAAQRDRWATLIRSSGLTSEQVDAAIESDAFGALTTELRRAEANHHDLGTLFPRLVAVRGFEDADDIASVLHHRLARATARPAKSGRTRKAPRLIVGLIPSADGPMADDMRHALDERRQLIEHHSTTVLDSALTDQEPWTAALGPVPEGEKEAKAWRRNARVVAAYRDCYQITSSRPLGPEPESAAQKIDHARADAALFRARAITKPQQDGPGRRPIGHDPISPRL